MPERQRTCGQIGWASQLQLKVCRFHHPHLWEAPCLPPLPSYPAPRPQHAASPPGPLFPRRCGYVFCSGHRHAQDHACAFDFVSMDKANLAKANTKVVAAKVDKL